MMGIIRYAILLFLFLTLIYAILTLINRGKQKDQLKEDYVKSEQTLSLDEFIDQGMAKYNRSLKAKLLLGVYLFPLIVFGILIYFAHL